MPGAIRQGCRPKGAAFRGRRPADAYGLGGKIDDGIAKCHSQERLSWLFFPSHLYPPRCGAQGHERSGDENRHPSNVRGTGSLRRLLGTDIAQTEQSFAADGTGDSPIVYGCGFSSSYDAPLFAGADTPVTIKACAAKQSLSLRRLLPSHSF